MKLEGHGCLENKFFSNENFSFNNVEIENSVISSGVYNYIPALQFIFSKGSQDCIIEISKEDLKALLPTLIERLNEPNIYDDFIK